MKPCSFRPVGRFTLPSIIACLAVVAVAACAGQRTPPPGERPAPSARSATSPPADSVHPALKPGDGVLLKVWREKEMSDTLQVDENGNLTLPLLGTRNVADIPTDSLKKQLMADYREYLKSPAIEIKVLRRISVLGEVKKPGLYPVDPTHSLTDALALAGGPTADADRSDIQLIRGDEVIRKSLDETRRIAATPIRSGDQIIVGRKSFFARNWQWIVGTLVSSTVIVVTR